jgi:elongator complex protein 3
MNPETWLEAHEYTPERLAAARKVLGEIFQGKEVWQAMRHHPLPEGGYLPKHILVAAYYQMVNNGEIAEDPTLLARIRMKPVRTLSGVTTVTVLTKSYPCPGKCIFCPTEERMPKSYLSDEPGARRGLQHGFDPYAQVRSRITALEQVGHPTDKIELLILGGTWSAYRRDYQEWFVKRCFDAMNEHEHALPESVGSGTSTATNLEENQPGQVTPQEERAAPSSLQRAQQENETADYRNVGLVIETRPDEITPSELAWLRYLGVTKVQMGAQSLDDHILELNQRGHAVADTLRACALLRAAGFKIVLHWMPNLLGATPESDRRDFQRLWSGSAAGLGLAPDEIKIYPCQLLENADLYQYWQRGEYQPYREQELIDLIADLKPSIPRYCRVNRVIRDIPSTHVVEGNKRTSLRQDVALELHRRGQKCDCLRCREVRGQVIDLTTLRLDDLIYYPAYAEEHFLSFVTPEDQVAGYLRLSLPMLPFYDGRLEPPSSLQNLPLLQDSSSLLVSLLLQGTGKTSSLSKISDGDGMNNDLSAWLPASEMDPGSRSRRDERAAAFIQYPETVLPDLKGAALIREVHVYGQSLPVGIEQTGAAQHAGLGTRLIEQAEVIACQHGFHHLAVIAAIGTRPYYLSRGFKRGETYLVKEL